MEIVAHGIVDESFLCFLLLPGLVSEDHVVVPSPFDCEARFAPTQVQERVFVSATSHLFRFFLGGLFGGFLRGFFRSFFLDSFEFGDECCGVVFFVRILRFVAVSFGIVVCRVVCIQLVNDQSMVFVSYCFVGWSFAWIFIILSFFE